MSNLRIDTVVAGANTHMINTRHCPDMVEMSWKTKVEKNG